MNKLIEQMVSKFRDDGLLCDCSGTEYYQEICVYIKKYFKPYREQLLRSHCPNACGFEGLDTYPSCGKCLVCLTKAEEFGSGEL